MSNLIGFKNEMMALLKVIRDDWNSEESQQIRNELIQAIEEDDLLLNVTDLKMVERATTIGYYRDWLFSYKGRGFVLSDCTNGHYGYRCTAEELFQKIILTSEK